MEKRRITLPDGRYLIYYRFDDEKKPESSQEAEVRSQEEKPADSQPTSDD